jgi:glycosyltransferase involved in cell wall biosynthesis
VVVPLYNEEDNVRPLLCHILESTRDIRRSREVIFVDDGSRDATFDRAKELVTEHPELRVIRLRRNFGQTPAMVAGIEHARGNIIVTMDGDLQNDARDIARFLEKIDEGYDLVVGWRQKRQDKLLTRRIPSKVANWIIARITRVPIKDNGCSLKAYRASVVKSIPLYSEMHRFIPAMNSMAGVRICEINVRHHARRFGESKYGLTRIYKVLLDLLTIRTILSTLAGPLRYFSRYAIALALVALLVLGLGIGHESFVLLSIATFALMSSGVLVCWGILCDLLLASGDVRSGDFAKLTLIHNRTEEGDDV